MVRSHISLLIAMLPGWAAGATAGSDDAPVSWPAAAAELEDPALEAQVDAWLGRMSLEAKIGQMIQAEIRHVTPDDVRRYHLGSVLNGGGSFPGDDKYASVEDWVSLADAFYEASMDESGGRQPIPVIWGTDAVHGHNNVLGATLFPHNIGLGAARDPELLRRIGEVTALEVAATGIDWVFAPTLAVVRNDRWGRTYEGYSEDPELVRSYAGPMIEGMQGALGSESWLGPGRVVATAKHFIGDGGTSDGIDQGDARLSEQELRDIHGQGYVTALEAGVQTVMATFNSWNGKKVHGDRHLLTEVLKEQMGFDGFVVSDWNGIGQVAGCSNADCAQAINAGIDLVMVPEDWKAMIATMTAQVKAGEIPLERIDDAVRRILRVKLRAGLFETGKPSERPHAGMEKLVGAADHRALAREAVRKSLVLLKNDGGVLPLKPDAHILVAGDGADAIGKQAGGWTLSWQGTGNSNEDFPGATSIHEGLRSVVEAAGGRVELSVDGTYEERPDVAVVVYGEDPYAEGQGDLESLVYSQSDPGDLALLRSLKAAGIPVVSVFLSGRPLWVNPELNASDAFVAAWLPGSEGAGIADVLVAGKDGSVRHDFTGRLSFSWPRDPLQVAINRSDPDYDPLFPYGFGLSYDDHGTLGDDLPENASGAGATEADDLEGVVFDGAAQPPYQAYVGDPGSWSRSAAGARTVSARGTVTVTEADRERQGDIRRIRWSGSGPGQFYFQAVERQDLRDLLEQDGALVFEVQLHEPPSDAVFLRMDCGYPCGAKAEVTKLLEASAALDWARWTLDLQCFAGSGADFERIDTPFLLFTEGELELSLAQVRLVPGAAAEAQVRCGED